MEHLEIDKLLDDRVKQCLKFCREYPEIANLPIIDHPDDDDLDLTEDQWNLVKNYYFTHGVEPDVSMKKVLEMAEAEQLLKDQTKECMKYSKSLDDSSDDLDDMSEYPNYSEIQEEDLLAWEQKRVFKIPVQPILTDDFINYCNDAYKMFSSLAI